ncbi:MAG TPA: HD domain-containing phosphohydrolase [Solirubrobacteraceae bacterium]|nr:HD domain-containing phosphohydrolase [Solirubrobacteraceae bacterium]
MDTGSLRRVTALFWAAAIGLAVVAVVAAGLALARPEDFQIRAEWLLLAALAAGGLAVLGRAQERRAERRALTVTQAGRGELERELRDVDAALRAEREKRGAAERARKRERQYSRDLQTQIARLHRDRGVLGDHGGARDLVLRLAVTLLDAGKGLLLDRRAGEMQVVSSTGFDNDPSGSHLAERFGQQVMERDHVVREDEPATGDRMTDADDEIVNLVAIPIYIHDEFSGVVLCANREGGFEDDDDEVLLALGDHAGAVLQNSRLHGALRTSFLATVRVMAEAIEAKDPLLRGHSEAVSRWVGAVAERMGIGPEQRERLVFASLLHDVGKIGISERILLKPAPLSPEERAIIELHPVLGHRILERVPELRPIAPAILHHHERYDGRGYPAGLAGQQIPLEARIIGVADCFAAMTADRPYRPGRSLDDACAELMRCAGSQFDPEVVRLFIEQAQDAPPSDGYLESGLGVLDDPEMLAVRNGDGPLGAGEFTRVDSLTMLYGHRHMQEAAQAEAERATLTDRPFAVVTAELTALGDLNRRDGYAAGDEALVSAARAVQRAAARTGGVPCRAGGCRLALVLPAAGEETARRVAGELAGDLSPAGGPQVGVAAWRPGESGADVVARARATPAAPLPVAE